MYMKKKFIFFGFVSLVLLASSCDIGVTEWIEVTDFDSPYVSNYDTDFYDPLMYGIDQAGQVHIRGSITTTHPATGIAIFTLPEEYWPSKRLYFEITIVTDTAVWAEGCVYIAPENGHVSVYGNDGDTVETAHFGEIIYSVL